MKKSVYLILLLLVLPIFLQLVVSQEPLSGLPPEIIEKQEQIIKYRNISAWQEIGTRTKEALLKNPVIGGIDNVLTKGTWVFRILFGMHYSLSITLLFVMALWFIVFLDGGNLIKVKFGLSTSSSLGISGGAAVLLAQFGVFKNLVNAVGTLIFAREAAWARFLLIVLAILFVIMLHYISKLGQKYLREQAEKEEKEEERTSREESKEYGEGKKEAEIKARLEEKKQAGREARIEARRERLEARRKRPEK